MKKIQLRLFAVIIILFFLLPLFLISNPKPLFAESVTITLKGVIRGAGAPNYLNGPRDVFVSGNYAYVVSGIDCSLLIFNISDPSNPTLVGGIRLQGESNYLSGANSVFVSGNYAYVTSGWDGNSLSIFNISSPSYPTLAGVIRGSGAPNYLSGAHGLFVSGKYAYVASWDDDSLSIFNISSPSNPTLAGVIRGEGAPNYLDDARSVFVSGDYAYVASFLDSSLSVFNISSPSNPTLAGVIRGEGAPNYLDYASSVFVNGNYAYVTSWYSLSIFNISNPSNPTLAGVIRGSGEPNYLSGASSVSVSGNYAYVASYYDNSLSIFNISDPSNPTLAGVIRGAGEPNYLGGAWSVSVSGNYAYVTSRYDSSLSIFEIENPVKSFVTRFYQECLSRDPDSTGLNTWVNWLVTGAKTGADVAYGFVFSDEFIQRNVSNDRYIKILYSAFFNRDADTAGYDSWLGYLNTGKSRQWVLAGFINSQEFRNLCSAYGINPGSLDVDSDTDTSQVAAFVIRFYQECLSRNPDSAGLNEWVDWLESGTKTGADVAYGFVFSDEFIQRNVSNDRYIKILYSAFFNRDADTAGYDSWLGYLNTGKSRQWVLAGFINSQEFKNLCAAYGINPGSINV